MDFGAILEFVGIDIVFLGTVTMLASYLGIEIWKSAPMPPTSDPNLRWIFRRLLRDLASVSEQGVLAVAVLVMSAAVAGMLVNGISDSLLDSKAAELSSKRRWVSAFLEGDEDSLKKEALKDVTKNLTRLPNAWGVLNAAQAGGIDGAQALVQLAQARAFDTGSAHLVTSLRYESLVLRTLRSLWLLASLLTLSAIVAVARRGWRKRLGREDVLRWWLAGILLIGLAGWGPYFKQVGKGFLSADAADLIPGLWMSLSCVAMTVLSFFAWRAGKRLTALSLLFAVLSITFLALWTAQSDRYYKKLLYSYASILQRDTSSSGGAPALVGSIQVGAGDAPTTRTSSGVVDSR